MYEVYSLLEVSPNEYISQVIKTFDNLEDASNYIEGNFNMSIRRCNNDQRRI